MPLSIGERLGNYEILGPLGKGGMGEVYRAKDTKLDREVAVKVLPVEFAQNAERLARFEREAKVLAALNHPNIATIYGVEESDGSRALVMELVPGKILQGPLPMDTFLPYAKQIADALEAAHEQGIVHRDLKPANIMVTPEGVVKVLDFGLAAVALPNTAGNPSDPQNSPTMTMAATQAGVIMGTAAYMSPEQAAGKPVDRRADIWSYGVVLYEMLAGKQLFDGETVSHTLADVLRAPIDFGKLPSTTPRPIRELVKRCLDRDVKKRLRDIGEARIAIQNYLANPIEEPQQTQVVKNKVPWVVAGVLGMALMAVTFFGWRQPAPELSSVQFTIDAPAGANFSNTHASTSVSPDGQYVVFGASKKGTATPLLWLRRVDSVVARPLPGTEGSNFPFWSPDGKSLAFAADSKLKRIDIAGGAPLTLAEIGDAPPVSSVGSWNADGIILFGSGTGLQRVSASGGGAKPLTKVDPALKEMGHGFPQFLDRNRFLYFVDSGDPIVQGVYASSLEKPQERVLVVRTGAKGVYVPGHHGLPSYLLWMQDQTLMAQRFNTEALRLEGDPLSVAEEIASTAGGVRGAYWASDAGLLAYRSGASNSTLAWISRDGKPLGDVMAQEDRGGVFNVSLAPDSLRIAVRRMEKANADIWLMEFARGVLSRLTFDPGMDGYPIWSADGRQVIFSSDREGGISQIYRKDATGGGAEQRITEGSGTKTPADMSRDGRYLLYVVGAGGTGSTEDLWAMPMEGDGKPIPVLQTPFREFRGRFSPDGKWIAYASNESGRMEIYVRAFPPTNPGLSGRWQVSANLGTTPMWRGDGKELYYLAPGGMRAVAVRTGPKGVEADAPRQLFSAKISANSDHSYAVTADGQKFLAYVNPDVVEPLTVITNFQVGLKK